MFAKPPPNPWSLYEHMAVVIRAARGGGAVVNLVRYPYIDLIVRSTTWNYPPA